MTRHRPSSVVLVVLVALALVASAAGTATATGLTAHSVTKIAAKVVAKKAGSLSVAHAGSADTAASATVSDRVRGQVFTLSTQPTVTTRNVTFPGLAPGTYLASYGFMANISTGATLSCQFEPGLGPTAAPSQSVAVANLATAEGSSIVTVGAGFRLNCVGSVAFGVSPYWGATVSFVPVTAGPSTAAAG